MSEHALTLNVPQALWVIVEKLAKTQNCTANQVAQDALEFYLADLIPTSQLSPEEKKTLLLKRLYKDRARRQLFFEKAVAEGKIHPLPKDIPLEQVREALSGIEDSLAAEVIKEREEGW